MNEEFAFTMVNDAGEEVRCEEIASFVNVKTDCEYMLYTNNTRDKSGKMKVFAARKDHGNHKLLPIQSDEEWELVKAYVNHLISE